MAVQQAPSAALGEDTIQAFASRLRGRLIRPADAEYDTARAVWNGTIDKYPALIARCSGTADVVESVNFARDHALLVAIRGGGHNVAGNAVCDGGLVIDLSDMRGVFVDPQARTVRVQGGADWGDVDRETQLFGLATPGGIISTTGVAGLTLHGGLGYLRRAYGLSLDNLLSVEIVTADGRARTAGESEHADLFWAVRGAGSNFGVVTAFEFRLHPVGPTVRANVMVYPLEEGGAVLAGFRACMDSMPDEVSGTAGVWTIPAIPMFPDHLHGRAIVLVAGVHATSLEEGERVMQPLRELGTPLLDMSGPYPYSALQSGFDFFFPAGGRYYWKSSDVVELSDELIAELARIGAERPSPLSTIDIWHNGGAMRRVDATATAFGRRDAPYLVTMAANWTDPADDEANIGWARTGWAALQRFSTGGMYLNFAGYGEEKDTLVRAAYGPNYERLTDLKAKYDPSNLFRMNQNIPPGTR